MSEIDYRSIRNNEVLITWSAPTHRFTQKNQLWFFGLGVFTVLGFVFLVIFQELMMGILLLSFSFLMFVMSAIKPGNSNYAIQSIGLEIPGKMYLWQDLKSYFIDYKEHLLIIGTNLSFPSELMLYLDPDKEQEIEDLLAETLPLVPVKTTDYMSMFDGFINRFTDKLPKKLTEKFVKHPNEKVVVDAADINKMTKKVKNLGLKLGKSKAGAKD